MKKIVFTGISGGLFCMAAITLFAPDDRRGDQCTLFTHVGACGHKYIAIPTRCPAAPAGAATCEAQPTATQCNAPGQTYHFIDYTWPETPQDDAVTFCTDNTKSPPKEYNPVYAGHSQIQTTPNSFCYQTVSCKWVPTDETHGNCVPDQYGVIHTDAKKYTAGCLFPP